LIAPEVIIPVNTIHWSEGLHKVVGKHHGRDIVEVTLQRDGQRVHILNYGCVVRRWVYDLPSGKRDLVLGFDRFEDYPPYSRSFGIIAGRVANRTRSGQFQLAGQTYQLSTNSGGHHLHGGVVGLGERVWATDVDAAMQRVRFSYQSPSGEEGYPGHVSFTVQYQLDADGLHCDMRALPDSPTPINLAQHNYYNLDGYGDIRNHTLQVDADYYLPVDDELLPIGQSAQVDGTRFDFRTPIAVTRADPLSIGHDHTLVLNPARDPCQPSATLNSSDGEIVLSLITDQPGLQLYTAKALKVATRGYENRRFPPFAGICLEAQHFPDSLNNPEFPSIIKTPDQPYRQRLSMRMQSSVDN